MSGNPSASLHGSHLIFLIEFLCHFWCRKLHWAIALECIFSLKLVLYVYFYCIVREKYYLVTCNCVSVSEYFKLYLQHDCWNWVVLHYCLMSFLDLCRNLYVMYCRCHVLLEKHISTFGLQFYINTVDFFVLAQEPYCLKKSSQPCPPLRQL